MKNHLLFCLSFFALACNLWCASRELTVIPGQSTFVWLDTAVSADNSKPLVFNLDLPAGFSFDGRGYIKDRRYTAGPLVMVGQTTTGTSPAHDGYQRTSMSFSFAHRAPITVSPNETYQVTLRMRHNITKGAVEALASWYSSNGSILTYINYGTVSGNSDWKEVTYTVRAINQAAKMLFWFNCWGGEEVNGTIEVNSFEVYHNGKKLQLNNNDFSHDKGGWTDDITTYNAINKSVIFEFKGSGAMGSNYAEKGYMDAGTPFRSAPYFHVEPTVKDGDYPIYLNGPGINETIIVKVRSAYDAPAHNVECALWLCESPFFSFPEEVQKATLDAAKAAGFNTLYVDGPTPGGFPYGTDFEKVRLVQADTINALAECGFNVYAYCDYEAIPQHKLIKSYLAQHPEATARDWCGRPLPHICPTYLMYENQDWWKCVLTVAVRAIRETKLSGIYWDIEYLTPLPNLNCTKTMEEDGMSACFCPRCIQRFKQKLGIDDLSRKEPFACPLPYHYEKMSDDVKNIIQRYPMEWTQFALNRTLWQIKTLNESVKEVRPDAQIRVYTGRINQGRWDLPQGGILRWSEFCGVDWTRMPSYVDAVMGCHDLDFYPETEAILLKEHSERQKPIILDISTLGYYGEKHRDYYARIMHIFAFCEAQGFGLWGFWELDGCDFSEISRVMHDVAKLKNVFANGHRSDALHMITTANPEVRTTTWIQGKHRVTFICNQSTEKTADVTLKYQGIAPAIKARYKATLIDGTQIEDPEKIELSLQSGEMKIVILEDVSFVKPLDLQ